MVVIKDEPAVAPYLPEPDLAARTTAAVVWFAAQQAAAPPGSELLEEAPMRTYSARNDPKLSFKESSLYAYNVSSWWRCGRAPHPPAVPSSRSATNQTPLRRRPRSGRRIGPASAWAATWLAPRTSCTPTQPT
jgi:hypothetical protein